MNGINRRDAIKLVTVSGLTLTVSKHAEAKTLEDGDQFSNAVFLHGVASGDSQSDSVVLWTRVETDADMEPVQWQIADTPDFSKVLQEGISEASAWRDHTVKVVPDNLQPGQIYFYRFIAKGTTSPIGRTRTLPTGQLDQLCIALASCSNYAFGYFNAYDMIARDEQVEFVLHTGDYIYEYGGPQGWGHETAVTIGREHEPKHEAVTLLDYRTRHAQYKRDAGSLRMHATHPLLALWDDHESANNPWVGGAQNHQPATEGPWPVRRDASIQAYYEWMPVRDPAPGTRPMDFWRKYSFGNLATLVTLESRHTARGQQIDYMQYAGQITDKASAEAFKRDVIGAPNRPMLSAAMEGFLLEALTQSVRDGQKWRVIGNAIPMARMLVPDLLGMGVIPDSSKVQDVPAAAAVLAWKAKWNLPFYTDTWDGYPVAREQFYDIAKAAGANDLLVLTGDSHSFWANQLFDGAGQAMGVEIGTSGISSPGDFIESGWDDDTARALDSAFAKALPEVRWTDNMHTGFVKLVFDSNQVEVQYRSPDTVLSPKYKPLEIRSETLVRKKNSLAYKT